MEIIKELITCEYCSKTFSEPIDLPCKKTICKNHINELKNENGIVNCTFCDSLHENIDIQINDKIQKLIESNVHNLLNNLGPKHKTALETTERMERKLQEYSDLSKNGELYVKKYFRSIRNTIYWNKEKLIQIINNKAESLVSTLNNYEKECLKNVTKEPIKNLDAETKQFKDWQAFLNQFKIDEPKWNQISSDANSQIKYVDKLIAEFKNNVLGQKQYIFKEGYYGFKDETFGQLKVIQTSTTLDSIKFDFSSGTKTFEPLIFKGSNLKEVENSVQLNKPTQFNFVPSIKLEPNPFQTLVSNLNKASIGTTQTRAAIPLTTITNK